MRRPRIVILVLFIVAAVFLFPATTRFRAADKLPAGLPPWFKQLDKDKDGQVSLQEWLDSGRGLREFRALDRNRDGFLVPAELLRKKRKTVPRLVFNKGHINYQGAVEENEELYDNKKAYSVLTIPLEAGKTYLIEQMSQAYFAFLYLEDPRGNIVDEHDSGGVGQTARIVHRAEMNGIYRIIATSQAGVRTGEFSLSVRILSDVGGPVPRGLPAWFKALDRDRDGQVSMREWVSGGKKLDDFRAYDLNDDGFVTADEVLRVLAIMQRLVLDLGHIDYQGALEEVADERYQNKRNYKVFTIQLQEGVTYQFDLVSQTFSTAVFLEDPDGEIVDKQNSGGRGQSARIVHRTEQAGIYRLVVTSQEGGRTGNFWLSVRNIDSAPDAGLKSLPAWFKELDRDREGQVSLQQWLAAGKKRADFDAIDANGDGFITAEEVLRKFPKEPRLELTRGQLEYHGTVEENDERYDNKKAYRVLTIMMEEGKTYHIEQVSQIYYAFLYLEDPHGEVVARHNSGGRGLTSQIVYRATTSGVHRIIASSQDGVRTGEFVLTILVSPDAGANFPRGLPAWFKELDKDKDGQVSLREWLDAGHELADFDVLDLNGDGFITADEVLRKVKMWNLKLTRGHVTYQGAIEDAEVLYENRKAYRVFTVALEEGKSYQIEEMSPSFPAFLNLEDPHGKIVARHSSGGKGQIARIVHQAEETGLYRIIATSQDGLRSGEFVLSVRAFPDAGNLPPKGRPAWFKTLDRDGHGQVSLQEWLDAGLNLADFRTFDLNSDGFITPDEIVRKSTAEQRLLVLNGQAAYHGTIDETTDARYQDKRNFKAFTIALAEGTSYHIEVVSPAFPAFVYLEDPSGKVVGQHNGGGNLQPAQIVFRPTTSGTYRIIAASADGVRTGEFALSVRVVPNYRIKR